MSLSAAAVMGDLPPGAVGKLTCRYGFAAFYATTFCLGMVATRGAAAEPLMLVCHYLTGSAIALWMVDDATRRGAPLPHSVHYLAFTLWPLSALLHLVRTRGLWGVGWWLVNAAGYILVGGLGQMAADLIAPRW